MWFIAAFTGYFLLATVVILDKFILTKSVSKPIVYTFYSTIFMFGALLAWPLGVEFLRGIDWIWAIFSGITFGFGLWALFIAMRKGEASHISPFNGAIVTIATYSLSSYFLGEKLSQLQIVGIAVLVFASLLLSFEKSRKNDGFHIGFVWAAVSGFLFAISHVSAKYLYELYPFITGFVWTRAFVGLVGLFTLMYPSVRRTFKKRQQNAKKEKKKHTALLVISNKILGVLAVVLIQYSASVGSVSLAVALSGLQFVLVFIIIYMFTLFAPKLFKEYFTKREFVVEMIAIILVVFGSALFVI